MTLDRRLETLRKLEPGWDSYDGQPPDDATLRLAQSFLRAVNGVLPGGWIVVPVSDGGVQLEYHENGFDIELWIDKHRP